MLSSQQRQNKQRRNVTLDPDVDEWLSEDVQNASRLINDLLLAYRAYGEAAEAVQYVNEKQKLNAGRA